MLRISRHVVHLVENDEFEPFFKEIHRFHERMDLIADNVNPAFIRRIEVDHVAFVGTTVMQDLEFVDEINDRRGFARAGGSIEEQIREILFFENLLEQMAVGSVEDDVVELRRAVFLDPGLGLLGSAASTTFCRRTGHG